MARTALIFFLLLDAALWGGLTQALGPMARPGPLLLRLQRLEKQVSAQSVEGPQPSLCVRGSWHFGLDWGSAASQGAQHEDLGSLHLAPLLCSFSGSKR